MSETPTYESIPTTELQQPPVLDAIELDAISKIRSHIAEQRSSDSESASFQEQVSGMTYDGLFISVEKHLSDQVRHATGSTHNYIVRYGYAKELALGAPLQEENLGPQDTLSFRDATGPMLFSSIGDIFVPGEAPEAPSIAAPRASGLSASEAEKTSRIIFPFDQDGQPHNPKAPVQTEELQPTEIEADQLAKPVEPAQTSVKGLRRFLNQRR